MARVLVIVVALAAAAAAAQFPEFVQQYQQRLGGAADELAAFVADFDEDAARHDLTRAQAIARYRQAGDAFLGRRGDRAVAIIERYQRLVAHRQDLGRAGPFARLVVFARDFDPDFVRATAADFRPAVPVTAEGASHAAAGFLTGLVLGSLLLGAFARRRRRRPTAR